MLEHEQDPQTAPEPGARKYPANRKKATPTPKRLAADQARQGQMTTVGRLLGSFPMTAEELADQWEIAADDVETITVKILKLRIGTDELQLMDDPALVDYNGKDVAARFGPGTYFIRPSGRKYAKNSAKLTISEALAKSCGFGRIPTTAADVVAERTIREATQGPIDPANLLAAIETIIERREREKSQNSAPIFQNPTVMDPMAALKSQFEQMQTMMGFMSSMEERAIKTVEMRMGKTEYSPSVEDTNSSLLEKLLPKALDIFGAMMANRNPAPVAAPQHQAEHQVTQHQAPTIAVKPTEPEVPPMPQLTQEEQQAIAGAVMMLKPYGGMIVDMAAQVADDAAIVAELEPWIPAPMLGSLEALSVIVQTHGPAILGQIHPALATERWKGILPKLVESCRE